MKGMKLMAFGAALFIAGLLAGVRIFAWHPYYPSYHACVMDNIAQVQGDSATRTLVSACRKYSK